MTSRVQLNGSSDLANMAWPLDESKIVFISTALSWE
jgi:hypothetical protein